VDAVRRRRRLATAVLGGLAVGAFAFGIALGDGSPPGSSGSRLTARGLVGERIVVGFPGTEPPAAVRAMIREGAAAGVVLFAENLPDRGAAKRLVARLESIPRPPGLRDPLLVMVDQEGGEVKRVSGPPGVSAAGMGARGAAFSRRQGRSTGESLAGLGIGVDLAPVLDVARPGGVIADTERGFGSSPARVTATAIPFADGLQAAGVAATAKHFPGLGSASENTDFAVQRIGLSKATLRRVDEAPYRAYVAAGGKMVMLSTAIYPALSPLPAALARPVATGELRGRLGFEGVSITDALGSVAVRSFGGPAKAAIAGARAGTDILLFTDYRAGARAGRALLAGLRSGRLARGGFEASARRVIGLRHGLSGRR
jgi:beta-N-acetylhexosaminidase